MNEALVENQALNIRDEQGMYIPSGMQTDIYLVVEVHPSIAGRKKSIIDFKGGSIVLDTERNLALDHELIEMLHWLREKLSDG